MTTASVVVLVAAACGEDGSPLQNAGTDRPAKTTIEGTPSPADSDSGDPLVDLIATSVADGIVGDRACIADVLSKLPDEDADSLSDFFEVVSEELTPGAQSALTEFNVRCFLDDRWDSADVERWLSLSGDEVCALLTTKSLGGLWVPDEYTFTAEPGQSGVCTYVDNNGDSTTLSVLDHFVAPEDEGTYLVDWANGFSAWLGPTVYRAMRGDVTFELRLGVDLDAIHATDDRLNCLDCEFTRDQARARNFRSLLTEGLRVLPPG